MKCLFVSKWEEGSELLVVPVWEGAKLAADVGSLDIDLPLKDFVGKLGETFFCYDQKAKVLLLGLGKQEAASIEALRRSYAAALKAAQSKKITRFSLLFPKCKQKEAFFQGMAEGLFLANYSFSYKTTEKAPPLIEQVTFIGVEAPPQLDEMKIIAEGVHFVRDLVNDNADDKTEKLLKAAKSLPAKVKVAIHDQKWLAKEKMGLILAVNRASTEAPYLIEAVYRGAPKSKEMIAIVGKGVSYDTGGLSLKTSEGMLGMKCDMAGGATALGAIHTAARLGLKVNVTVLVPIVENAIGSKSYKLGDVYRSYSGKTVEINNTDAEGRLILADALSYAAEKLKPTCIIDLATLTGACVVALGEEVAGLISNDDALAEGLLDAAENTDESICRLPLVIDYKESFKSEIADMVNSGGRDAGAIKGALFLSEFVGDIPWAHLDIAGVAYWTKPKHYHPTKATGFAVRLLVDFLSRSSS